MEKIISEIENTMYSNLNAKSYGWLINKVTDLWLLNKEFIKRLKEEDLYRTLINKYGKGKIWSLNNQDLIEAIECYYNDKIDKLAGPKFA